MRLTPSSSVLALVPLALALGSGCVTRTVYVVDDDPRPSSPGPTARAEASAPAYAEPSGGGGGSVYVEPEQAAGIQYESDFYEPLSPYGTWVAYPGYGQVFVPSQAVVGVGFRPYTHGHWERTEWGYTWVDHHPFGWATGHYGRWFYDSSYGWAWVPGRVWAPAWVSWRSGGGYVGWAPMPPGAAFGGAYSVYETSWVFVSYSGFGGGYVGSALVIGPAYRTCYYSTYPARETYVVYGRSYYRGPDEDEIVRGGGHVVHRPVRDVERERPVTRPPEGTTITRSRDRGRDNDDRNSGGPSGNSRGRDDDASGPSGSGRGRDDARDPNDNGRGRDDDRDSGRPDGAGRGRDDDHAVRDPRDARGSATDDVRGQTVDPRDPRANDRDPRDPRGPVVDPRDPRANDRDPRDPRGPVVDPRGELVDERMPTVVEPRPVVVDGVGTGRDDNGRGNDGRVNTGRVDERPSLDLRDRDDPRAPYLDDSRPVKQYPENPDRVRPITERPDVGVPSRTPVGPATPSRGPAPSPYDRTPSVYDRTPANIDRTPSAYDRTPSAYDRTPARPVGPSIDRGPQPSRSPVVGPSPSRPSVNEPGAQQPAPEGQPTTKKKATAKKDSKGKAKPKR